MTIVIREATIDDRGAVIVMLREFMTFLDAVAQTPEGDAHIAAMADLTFGLDPITRCIIAELNGEPVGYLAYYFGVWEVDIGLRVVSLFVRQRARRLGAGRALMAEAGQIGAERGAKVLHWLVWKKNPGAIAFYRSLGGEPFDEDIIMTLPIDNVSGK